MCADNVEASFYFFMFRAVLLLESEQMLSLMNSFVGFDSPLSSLPPTIIRQLASTLLSCAVGNRCKMEEFLRKVFFLLLHTCKQVKCANFPIYDTEYKYTQYRR